jgi:hypothetical protein
MQVILRALLLLGGGFFILMGIGFLLNPVSSGADFGIAPQGTLGLASIRADMTAFFIISGVCLAWGTWSQKGDLLLAAAGLMGVAIVGRLVTLAVDGPHEGWFVPVIVEAVTVALALFGRRILIAR